MKAFLIFIVVIGFLPLSWQQSTSLNQSGAGWKGIVPLHSTRSDVEKLLGQPQGKCNCIYLTEHETVTMRYAADKCKGQLSGWNVPSETVLSFSVIPRLERAFDELKLDKNEFVVTAGDAGFNYYTSSNKGIQYVVSSTDKLRGINYTPSTSDSYLRCKGFPAFNPINDTYRRYSSYSDKEWGYSAAILTNLTMELRQSQNYKGYIFVYGDTDMSVEHIESYKTKMEDLIFKELKILPEQ